MDVMRTGRKGRHLNTVEEYHIHKIIRDNIDTDNPTFQTLHELYDRWQQRHPWERYIRGNNHTERPYKSDTHTRLVGTCILMGHVSMQKKKKKLQTHNKISNTCISDTSLNIQDNSKDNNTTPIFMGITKTTQVNNKY
jgi:hypothetical protein